MKRINNQKGFTLVEIAIVLVIIGLLLGGVFKGQELIGNSRVKSAIKDMDGVITAYNAYIERYRRIPGDDGPLATLTGRGGQWTTVTQFGGVNSVLNVTAAETFTGGTEGDNFWQHVRAAGFVSGNPATAGAAALPQNAFGGLIGVTSVAVTGQVGTVFVCMSQVPGKAAAAIDSQLDDGLPNTVGGNIMATLGVAGANTAPGAAAAAPYNETAIYTVCRVGN